MDRGRCLRILRGYGVGPKTLRLIKLFWTLAEMVCRAGGNYGTPFGASRGVTQGGPLSPKLFNILVDAIVREWLRVLFGDDAALGLDEEMLRVLMALFYADDGFIASRDPDMLQEASDVLVGLFDRVGLVCNTTKTKALTFVPGKIRTRLSVSSYQRRFGLGTRAAWMSRRVECDQCGQELAASSLGKHMETQHGVFQAQVVAPEFLEDRPARTYEAHESADGIYRCPVPDCEGEARQKWGLRRHFRDRHPLDMVSTPGEGVLPRCENCGMQTSELAFGRGHLGTQLCREGGERRRQHQAAADAALALRRQFTVKEGEDQQCRGRKNPRKIFLFALRHSSCHTSSIHSVLPWPSRSSCSYLTCGVGRESANW
ncbi:hypothetical protein ACHAWF_016807 [Thalassiosira exigua]